MSELIATTSQQSAYGAVVTMYRFDATRLGGNVIHVTTGPYNSRLVRFAGDVYSPVPIQIGDLSFKNGELVAPTLMASNINGIFVAQLLALQDLVGTEITLIRTFDQFLDDGPNPDPTARWPDETFFIDQLISQDHEMVRWRLASLIDQPHLKLPRRQIVRDVCMHNYRRFVDGQFDYTQATCPYTGSASFDANDTPVSDDKDRCSQMLSGCRLRFGEHGILPGRFFPGAARVRENV